MKLTELYTASKTVEYFGIDFIVPAWTKAMACNDDGVCIAYSETPTCYGKYIASWDGCGAKEQKIAKFLLQKTDEEGRLWSIKWQDTCVEYK